MNAGAREGVTIQTVFDDVDGVVLPAKVLRERTMDTLVVLDDQDAHAGMSSGPCGPPPRRRSHP